MANSDNNSHVRNWRNWAIIILLIAFGISVLTRKPAPPPDNGKIKQATDSIAYWKKQVTKEKIEKGILREKARQDSIQRAETKKQYIRESSQLKTELAKAKERIQQAIDTIPEVAAYVEAADTLQAHTEARVAQLEAELYIQGKHHLLELNNRDAEIRAHERIINHQSVIITEQAGVIDDQGKTIKKQGRLIKWLTAAIPIAAVGALLAAK